MSIIGWLILGLIAGFIASKIINKTGEGIILDIVLGIVGAVVGGFLFSLVGAAPVTGLNVYSMNANSNATRAWRVAGSARTPFSATASSPSRSGLLRATNATASGSAASLALNRG